MFESYELINFIIGTILFFYYIFLSKQYLYKNPYEWIVAFIFILLSDAATIFESFFLPETLNILEHFFFSVACLLLFLGMIKKTKTENHV